MKKIFLILFTLLIIVFSASGCNGISEAEKNLEKAQSTASELENALDNAKRQSSALQSSLDRYDSAVDRLY